VPPQEAVQVSKTHLKEGLGKTGASRRGNTSSPSGSHSYWV
jgi:hypothetical protein